MSPPRTYNALILNEQAMINGHGEAERTLVGEKGVGRGGGVQDLGRPALDGKVPL